MANAVLIFVVEEIWKRLFLSVISDPSVCIAAHRKGLDRLQEVVWGGSDTEGCAIVRVYRMSLLCRTGRE